MKNIDGTTHLFIPDILAYIHGRDMVSEIVLNACKGMVKDGSRTVSLGSKLFKELNFNNSHIIAVILEASRILKVKFSYTLLLQQEENCSVEDMGGQLWKYMVRVVKNN